ncbi:hypothetical protein DNH61_09590 [Paenibacillus sambharensis]|uniref:Uncharacterized protein n=1 Tax=Paenibacillus sambharensis TaxID=1803190 RepID=A0A2W1LWI9_9BACL|nr:hypothetical protein DNH61_09590 [Paenibacillus sambharensis]
MKSGFCIRLHIKTGYMYSRQGRSCRVNMSELSDTGRKNKSYQHNPLIITGRLPYGFKNYLK